MLLLFGVSNSLEKSSPFPGIFFKSYHLLMMMTTGLIKSELIGLISEIAIKCNNHNNPDFMPISLLALFIV